MPDYKLVVSEDLDLQNAVFQAPLYRPKMMLEVLTSRGVRITLIITYTAAIIGTVFTAVPSGIDNVIDRYVLVPALAVGYLIMVYQYLRHCVWECSGLILREQVWTFLTLCVCAVCALEVAMHTFQKIPHATVLAARVSLQNVLKLLWLLLMDSFSKSHVYCCSGFYGWKLLFVTCNVILEAVMLSLYSKYSPQETAVAWCFDGIFVVWLLYLMRRSKAYLASQPYLQTRTHQLGFRFFCYQTTVVISSIIICAAVDAATHRNNLTGLLLIQHTYMWVLGYVHLPIRGAGTAQSTIQAKLSEGHCSFSAAKMCLQASYEVYQEKPYLSPQSAITEQWLNRGGWEIPKNLEVIRTFSYPAVGVQIVIVSVAAPLMTVVAFRGTDNWKNVATDLATWRVAPKRFGPGSRPDCLSGTNVMIHKGFWSAYQSIRDDLWRGLKDLYQPESKQITDLINPKVTEPLDAPIVFTGHSLGGALATLAALDNATLMRPLYPRSACFTFGSPRVGSYSFASCFDKMVPDAMRLVFERDLVTDQPKFCCAFKHIGTEILIDARGNCITNPTFVEKAFLDSKNRIGDHSLYAYLRGFNACEKCGNDDVGR